MTTREELLEKLQPHWGEGWFQAVDCGDGWIDFIANLHERLMAIDPNYRLQQVKEKFAGLRFYAEATNDRGNEFYATCHAATDESYHICERCSSRENVAIRNQSGWQISLCEECDARRIARKAEDRPSS